MCKVVLLAVMEAKSENTEMVTFFNLFNECFKEFAGGKSYNFLPYGFMVDEAGANFNAIQAVLGQRDVGPQHYLPMAL